jgi:hypothetical protein
VITKSPPVVPMKMGTLGPDRVHPARSQGEGSRGE